MLRDVGHIAVGDDWEAAEVLLRHAHHRLRCCAVTHLPLSSVSLVAHVAMDLQIPFQVGKAWLKPG